MATAAREFMSPEDLAEYLGVPLPSVYAWRYKGTGPPAYRVGRHVRYRVEDVAAWLDDRADPPRPER
jgi:excisionase family DNA binding protein